ncbi:MULTISPECIES: hypothetical protein [unclassified Erythrobacter]|jgi:hypothetical protein|uniref:hypothetical protein n=1 Tax=unclassified Erythrobacter TaxID=2633097 RepID=UPI00076D12CB|nr:MULTISPECIES: hypothetical protein [unclassified Erythrobacter]KWV93672.1 hypothetical protein ASS64_12275 [Erythrobacter sp. AP23]MBO6767551.1 hypothetical protein [Erythrobacter sp.]
MTRTFILLTATAALAACAPMESDADFDPAADAPPVRVVGEPRNCINRNLIRNSRVRSDYVIDFEMTGNRVYRSTLEIGCPRLGFERAFIYETPTSQLCSTEIIYVLEDFGGQVQRGAGCSLGDFVPVEYVEEGEG